jgi:hypothetical protein
MSRFLREHLLGMFIFAIVTGVIGNLVYDRLKVKEAGSSELKSDKLKPIEDQSPLRRAEQTPQIQQQPTNRAATELVPRREIQSVPKVGESDVNPENPRKPSMVGEWELRLNQNGRIEVTQIQFRRGRSAEEGTLEFAAGSAQPGRFQGNWQLDSQGNLAWSFGPELRSRFVAGIGLTVWNIVQYQGRIRHFKRAAGSLDLKEKMGRRSSARPWSGPDRHSRRIVPMTRSTSTPIPS